MKVPSHMMGSGRFLAAKQIPPGVEPEVEITGVTLENFENEDSKLALAFKGKDRLLLLNKTNLHALVEAFGDETAAWIGRRIILFRMTVTFQGAPTPAIRIRIPPQPQMQPQQAASMAAQAPAGDPNDDIPW